MIILLVLLALIALLAGAVFFTRSHTATDQIIAGMFGGFGVGVIAILVILGA
jgi:hypothetical protein